MVSAGRFRTCWLSNGIRSEFHIKSAHKMQHNRVKIDRYTRSERERKRGVKEDSQQFVSFCVDNHKTQTNKRREKHCYEKSRKKIYTINRQAANGFNTNAWFVVSLLMASIKLQYHQPFFPAVGVF